MALFAFCSGAVLVFAGAVRPALTLPNATPVAWPRHPAWQSSLPQNCGGRLTGF